MKLDPPNPSLPILSRAVRAVLEGFPALRWQGRLVAPSVAASPLQLLPAWLAAADLVWRDMGGQPIGLTMVARPAAPLGAVVLEQVTAPIVGVLLAVSHEAVELMSQANDAAVLSLDPLVAQFMERRALYLPQQAALDAQAGPPLSRPTL